MSIECEYVCMFRAIELQNFLHSVSNDKAAVEQPHLTKEEPAMGRVYPATPLETQAAAEQTQFLAASPPPPPSYEQATVTPAETTGPTPAAVPAHTVVVIPAPATSVYGPWPMDVECPYCHNHTRTRLRFRPNSRTHLIALLLCLFQLYCFVCLPYCIDSCMNTNHYCGICDHYLGTYVRS